MGQSLELSHLKLMCDRGIQRTFDLECKTLATMATQVCHRRQAERRISADQTQGL